MVLHEEAALIALFSFCIAGLIVKKVAAHKATQRWIEEHRQSILEYSPEDLVDNQPPIRVMTVVVLLWGIGVYSAMSLLYGHLLGF